MTVNFDVIAWLVFAAAALLVTLVAAVEVALTAVDRAEIRRRHEAGESRAVLVDDLLQDSAQFWLTSMLVKTVGLLAAGVAVGRVFTASASFETVIIATFLAWLALAAGQIVGRSLAVGSAEQVALRLAQAKARWVGREHPGRLVLGADSVLDVDGRSLGKPVTAEVAVQRWHELRGRSAHLITGQCLIHPGGEIVAAARTTVHFGDPDDEEIAAYVATGEPLQVAGGFTLDGYGSAFVAGVEGDPANVIGLGIPLLRTMVRQAGLRWTDLWDQAGATTS